MPVEPGFEFSNLERLIEAIGGDQASSRVQIDAAHLLAELALLKEIVADSPYPDIKARIPGKIRPSITGPEFPLPSWTGPEIPIPGGGDNGVTGPEIDTNRCPVCKRPY